MIVIDSNERKTIDKVLKSQKIPFTREVLTITNDEGKEEGCGDYSNTERGFLVERKTAIDYRESLKSGHLEIQLARMMNFDGPKFVLFEGDLDALIDTTLSKGLKILMRVFPFRLAHVYGVHWIHCYDSIETVDALVTLDRYYRGIKTPHIKFESIYMKNSVDERIRNMLTVPMIGQKNIEIFLKKYKSIHRIAVEARDNPKALMKLGNKVGIKKCEYIRDMYFGTNIFDKRKKRGQKKKKTTSKAQRQRQFAIQRSKYEKKRKRTNKK